jgi:hypothetical protein
MRIDQFIIKPFKIAMIFAGIILLSVSLSPATATGNNAQDLSFRLMNIERKIDQVQLRVDAVERMVQNQAISNTGSSNVSTQALLDLQQQQFSLAQQVITMQKQMLEMRKELDRQASRGNDQGKDTDKKDSQKQETQPKVQPKKP